MSTLPNQASLAPAWKQEVNRRLAAHKSRSAPSAGEPEAPMTVQRGAGSRASQAAERVAARFASAPSYSEVLAEEARAAVRAAEAASRAALEAQAAAESVLAGLEASSAAERSLNAEAFHGGSSQRASEPAREATSRFVRAAAPRPDYVSGDESFQIRWEAGLPARTPEPAAASASLGPHGTQAAFDEGWESRAWQRDYPGGEGREAEQPLHANLIEFPRELVATRKVRPRLAEGPLASERPVGQLSIFEVDPETISTQPEAMDAAAGAAARQGPKWSGIELDYQPEGQLLEETAPGNVAAAAPVLHLAPIGARTMAALVDGALIFGAFLAAALAAALHAKQLPTIQEIELGSAAALLVLGGIYEVLFFTLAAGTPGMRYAGISLCTFDGQIPARAQLRSRMVALLLSLLPLGLGIAWAIFDPDHLCWHDRLSGTYQRKE